MARKYSKRMIKRKISKRRMSKNKTKRRITRRRIGRKKNIRGGNYNCPLHPAHITGAQATSDTMTRPVAHHGEAPEINKSPTYWSNYDQIGDNVFGILN